MQQGCHICENTNLPLPVSWYRWSHWPKAVVFQSQWQSRYVTEGRDNLDSNPLVSAGVDLTHQAVTAGVWQAWANGSDYRENNLFVEYAPYVEHWSPYLNVTYLQFHPQGADDVETGAGFTAPIQPWLSVSLDGTWSFLCPDAAHPERADP